MPAHHPACSRGGTFRITLFAASLRPLSRVPLILAACLLVFCLVLPGSAWAGEIRRSMSHLRPLLMGGAQVGIADEAASLFYNPAVIARMREDTLDAFSIQVMTDLRLKQALVDEQGVRNQYTGVDLTSLQGFVGTSLYFQTNIRMPFSINAEEDTAWGYGVDLLNYLEVLERNNLPALLVEYALDAVLFKSYAGDLGGGLTAGTTIKLVVRNGLYKEVDSATLYSTGSTLDLNNDPDFKEFSRGVLYPVPGMDFGAVYEVQDTGSWRPRMGVSVVNIGSYDSGEGFGGLEFGSKRKLQPPVGGRLPLVATVGFAISPVVHNIRYTMGVDWVDVTETVLPPNQWNLRSRVGFEMGIGPKKDGSSLFSILAGYNATHFSVGFITRTTVFEIGMGRYKVERGDFPGDHPDDRRIFIFGLHF